ncbi:hypothetical protein E1A91_D04G029600v1 [Gossypium mustelinum]|uniref:F-box domain-containing protein n=1 Tax=Gossypium mustelinum TaxID=34275 RepID=A0A5D2V957_GOSMU|nr:hypothetical protein E1A91_D04G029600v1 [Gossypium mustelinum]
MKSKVSEMEGGNGELSIDTLNLNALPQDCIATIISFTSPRDASLIPSSLSFSSKKELYLSLCENPVLIEGGRKSFWLEKVSGKKCYILSPKDLYIEWVNTPTYWRWVSIPEARFEEVSELLSVCWFEIRGKISISRLSPMTLYKAYLVFKVHDVYGFDYYPVNLSVGLVGTNGSMRTAYLDPEHVLTEQQSTPVEDEMFPKARVDGGCVCDGELEMTAIEIDGGNWKGGLIFQGIEIRAVTPNLCDSNLGLDSLPAAESDTAWESLLPCQYHDLVPTLVSFSSKKDIYLSLGGNPVLIEVGWKSFWLEKASGKKCYMLSPKELYIEWVNTPTYWSWVRILEARSLFPPCRWI